MPVPASIVGATTTPFTHLADARWTMAYAAGLGDTLPAYLDTAAGDVIAHPLFPVCLEWPVILGLRSAPAFAAMPDDEQRRGVHASHDLELMRPIRGGETLTTSATVIGAEQRRPGTYTVMRIETRAQDGELVARTWQGSLYRGVELQGSAHWLETPPDPPALGEDDGGTTTCSIAIDAGAAHVYTECARIFNPIHTDRAVALAAGLPDIILHGTATLALAVSRIVDDCLDGDPSRVRRIGGRFSAMVRMPSRLTLRLGSAGGGAWHFEVDNEAGESAISAGFLLA